MGAEAAAAQSFDVIIKGAPIQVAWGRPKIQAPAGDQAKKGKLANDEI